MTAQATITPKESQEQPTTMTVDTKTGEVLNTTNSVETKKVVPATTEIKASAILDLSNKKFLDGLKRRNDNRLALIQWVDKNLTPSVDFGSIDVKTKNGSKVSTKPFLFKSGAEKIMAMLGLTATFPNLQKYEEAAIGGIEIKQIVLRCLLISSNGLIVSEGVGCKNIAKDNGDLNKSFKMAEKSATIDAILRTMGLSEMFTQDKEAVEEQIKAEAQQSHLQTIGNQSQLHLKIEQLIKTEAEVKGVNPRSLREFVKSILVTQSNGTFEHFPDITQDWANWLINHIPQLAVRHANGE